MAQQADPGPGSGAPFAKFAAMGDTLIGAFAGSARRQQRDFESGDPKVKTDGKPLMEEVMHFVAMPGTTAGVGKLEEGLTQIEPGAHVRYSVSGFKWGQVIDGRKKLPEYSGFKAGTSCSGDIYTVTLAGWSAETKNPQGAINAGFTVVENRIMLRSEDEREKWVLIQLRNSANTNPARDFTIQVRRPTTGEKRWEQEADALFATKPWETQLVAAGDQGAADEEPF